MKIGANYLTVDRAKALLEPHYLHEVLLHHPGFSKIVPGVEDSCFEGAIDCHAHVGPDFVPRAENIIEYAKKALAKGMSVIVLKNHYHLTSHLAEAAQYYMDEYVEREGLNRSIQIYGDLCMNFGLDPRQAQLAVKYERTKILRMPTFETLANQKAHGKSEGITILDSKGEIKQEVREIFDIAKSKGIGICSGHLFPHESIALASLGQEKGVPVILNHVVGDNAYYHMNLEDIKKAAAYDNCYLGIYAMQFLPSFYAPIRDPWVLFEAIKEVGVKKCILASDSGQVLNWPALEGMQMLVRALLGFGFNKEEIKIMFLDNPAHLLGLNS